MVDMIIDGKGRGYRSGVNNENRLMVEAITYSGEHHANHEGHAYNMMFDVTPTAAGDCFLYVKNSNAVDLVIEGLWLRVGSAEQILMNLGDVGTPSGGSDVVPANLNAGTTDVALGTFQAGNDITGLSGGITINKGWVANTATAYFNFEQDVIIPQNSVFTMWVVTGAVNVAGTLVFHFHEHA